MNRDQVIDKAEAYRCGKSVHRFSGGSVTYDSISKAKKAVGPKADAVAERPGEKLYPKMQARWIAEEARQKAEAERLEAERIAAEAEAKAKEDGAA